MRLQDLYHVIDLCGKLLSKKEPAEDDGTPFEEFNRYVKVYKKIIDELAKDEKKTQANEEEY